MNQGMQRLTQLALFADDYPVEMSQAKHQLQPEPVELDGPYEIMPMPSWDIMNNSARLTPPLPPQPGLFGDTQFEAVLGMMPELDKLKTDTACITRVSAALGIDRNSARRLYLRAEEHYKHQLAYEQYLKYQDYYDWLRSDEGRKARLWQYQEMLRAYAESLGTVQEPLHVVSITPVGRDEVIRLLDATWWGTGGYYGPMDYLVYDLKHITRHDAQILLRRGYMQVIDGDPDTVLHAYDYPREVMQKYRQEPVRCTRCGRGLHYNVVGVNQKLGAKSEEHYRCIDCLGISEAYAQSMVERFRSDDCPLFV